MFIFIIGFGAGIMAVGFAVIIFLTVKLLKEWYK